MPVARARGTLRLFVPRCATIEINQRRKVIRRSRGQAVLELRIQAGRRAPARPRARGR